MKNINYFLITLAALVAVVTFSWLGYNLYNRYTEKNESPLNAIPGNTALIIQLNQAGNLLEELNRSNLIWKSVSRFPGINMVKNELHYFDSASRRNPEISQVYQKYKIWVSISLSGRSSFGALYLAAVPGANAEQNIIGFISELIDGKALITSTPYSTTKLHRIQSGKGGQPFYFAVMKGVFTGSFHANLVKRSLDRLSLHTPLAMSPGFKKVESTTGKRADANIYLNYRFFSLVLSTITREDLLPDLVRLSGFADWSGLDLIIKKDELLFNGITVSPDSSQQFLSLFSEQEPVRMKISSIVPSDVRYFISYGWNDPAKFSNRFQSRTINDDKATRDQDLVSGIIDRYELNLSEYFLPWVGHEAMTFALENPENGTDMRYNAISVLDSGKAMGSLMALCDSIGLKYDSVSYRKQKIIRTPLPPFFPALFGEIFGEFESRSFTVIRDHLITSESPKSLERIIDCILDSATLEFNPAYVNFSSGLPETYNIYTYINTYKSIQSIKGFLNDGLSARVNPVLDSLRKIEMVAFHFANTDGAFYSNVCLRYNSSRDQEGPLQWMARLDTTVGLPPQIISIGRHAEKAIVLSDINNKIYSISAEGEINWKLPVTGKVRGSIHPVQLPGEDSVMLLFNTDSHLYLLHADGRYAERYPMKFPLKATNGLTIIPDKGATGFDILIAFEDHRVYRFDLDGTSVTEWKRPSAGEEIIQPAEYLKSGNRIFFVITGINGKTVLTDHDGNVTLNLNPRFNNSPYSGFFINKTNRKGLFLTTSKSGKLVFIQEKGMVSEVTLNIFTPDHRFMYHDITGNDSPDFIFSDRNQIFYYNRNYKLIYSYAFRRDIKNDPFLLRGRNGKSMVGYVVPETSELFLFDDKGYHELDPGVSGNTPFDIGMIRNQEEMSLVVGSGSQVRCYRLTKF